MPTIKKNQPWTVWRITPNGEVKGIKYTNHREAVNYTAMSLVDNGYATKREAQEWAATIPTHGVCSYKAASGWLGAHLFEFIPASQEDQEPELAFLKHTVDMGKGRI